MNYVLIQGEIFAITAKLSKTTTISDKILWEFIYLRVHLKFPLSYHGMLQTHNIAWRNFCLLFLNIIKSGKRAETENCAIAVFSIIFVIDCLKKSEKLILVFYSCSFYIKLKACNYPLHYNFVKVSHYLNNCNIKNSFSIDKRVI